MPLHREKPYPCCKWIYSLPQEIEMFQEDFFLLQLVLPWEKFIIFSDANAQKKILKKSDKICNEDLEKHLKNFSTMLHLMHKIDQNFILLELALEDQTRNVSKNLESENILK